MVHDALERTRRADVGWQSAQGSAGLQDTAAGCKWVSSARACASEQNKKPQPNTLIGVVPMKAPGHVIAKVITE